MRAGLWALVPTAGFGVACASYTPDEGGQVDGLRTLTWSGLTGSDATIDLEVPVDGEGGLLLSFEAEGTSMVFVNRVTSPSGEVVLDAEAEWSSDENRTMALYPAGVVSFNWPMLRGDALEAGTWEVEAVTTDVEGTYEGDVPLNFYGQLKADDALDNGLVHVDLVYVNGAGDEPDWVDAIEQASERWRSIYAEIGITVEFESWTWDSGDLAPPGYGNAQDYVAIAESTPFRSINLVITPEIAGQSDLYGIAGGIPGPLAATATSAVTVSISTNAGPDLSFSSDEIRLLGETMAHESGHFAGLFHPVEYAAGGWDNYDAVDDTQRCIGESDCYADLGENLMFPYPVCDDVSCDPQGDLTEGQGEVANRYTGVE